MKSHSEERVTHLLPATTIFASRWMREAVCFRPNAERLCHDTALSKGRIQVTGGRHSQPHPQNENTNHTNKSNHIAILRFSGKARIWPYPVLLKMNHFHANSAQSGLNLAWGRYSTLQAGPSTSFSDKLNLTGVVQGVACDPENNIEAFCGRERRLHAPLRNIADNIRNLLLLAFLRSPNARPAHCVLIRQ